MPEIRIRKYWEALSEAIVQAMTANPNIFVMGEGVDDPKGVFGTTREARTKFGPRRVFDTPLSENAMTGIGIGAAISGYPNIMIHMRNEFLLLAMDQVVNHAAKWHYMFGGKCSVPITIRCLIGRGWGQAAQHSQSFHAMFAHVPGLKVILPATPFDAKGLLYSAIRDPNPVICIEHRWLYDREGEVPEHSYSLPIGKANLVAPGKDITCVAVSYQVLEALNARDILLKEGIEMEVIDLRSVRPMDADTILSSVRKTGRLIVTDISPKSFGITAEVCSLAVEQALYALKAPPVRIALPEAPTPCGFSLENAYYPTVKELVAAAHSLLMRSPPRTEEAITQHQNGLDFTGPF